MSYTINPQPTSSESGSDDAVLVASIARQVRIVQGVDIVLLTLDQALALRDSLNELLREVD